MLGSVEAFDRLRNNRRDREAWSVLVRVLLRIGRVVARGTYGLSSDRCEECVHEALSRIIERAPISQLKTVKSLYSYFRVTLVNIIIDEARSEIRRGDGPLNIAQNVQRGGASISSENLEDIERMLAGIEYLADGDRLILRALLEGATPPEVAARFGISYGAAALRIFRAKDRLRTLLRRTM